MLPRELLKKLRQIEIVTERLVHEQLAGQYHSVFKGRGIAFSEVRQYQPGDDVRSIDWNVIGAHERAVRQAVRRRARDDRACCWSTCRRSGRFGSREQEKRELAAEIAALLRVLRDQEQRPRRAHHLHRRVEQLRAAQEGQEARAARDPRDPRRSSRASRRTDLRARARVPRRGRAPARGRVPGLGLPRRRLARYEQALRIAARRHDLVPVTVTDPLEEELPDVGFVELEDLETGEVVEFDTSGPEARAFARRTPQARATRARRCSEAARRMDFVNVRTDRPYVPALVAFFEARARRLRH